MKPVLALAVLSLSLSPVLGQVPTAPPANYPSGAPVPGVPMPDGPKAPAGSVPVPADTQTSIPPVPKRVPLPLDEDLRHRAHDLVVEAFSSKQAVIRANAVEAAEHTFPKSDAQVLALKALSDPSSMVRFAGCVACGNLGYADTHDALLKLAYDTDPNVRLAARYGLHKLGDHALTNEMVYGVDDDRAGVRGNTVMLMGMLGEKSAIPILKRKLGDGALLVRTQVAEALWKLDNDQKYLEYVLAGTFSQFGSEQVAALLAAVSPRRAEVARDVGGNVYRFLRADAPEVAVTAARCLGTLGSDEGLGVVYKYAGDNDARRRAMCAQAFGEIARSDEQDALKKLADDSDANVRLAAATAILKLRPPVTASGN